MGLYGNIIVVPTDEDYWPPAHREIAVTLDDVLIEDGRVARFDANQTNYSAMGRFGNTMLTRGETLEPPTTQLPSTPCLMQAIYGD